MKLSADWLHPQKVVGTVGLKIDLAKKIIQEFIHNLATFLEGGKKKEIYQLSIALFPLKFQS